MQIATNLIVIVPGFGVLEIEIEFDFEVLWSKVARRNFELSERPSPYRGPVRDPDLHAARARRHQPRPVEVIFSLENGFNHGRFSHWHEVFNHLLPKLGQQDFL